MKIKYDLKTLTINKYITIVSGLLLALGIFFLFHEIDGAEIVFLFSLYLGGACLIIGLASLLSAFFYLRRLKTYGYEIPMNKNDYGGVLENLPRDPDNTERSAYARYTRMGVLVAFAMLGVFLILDLSYYIKWHFMGENSKSLFIMLVIFYSLVWLIYAFILKKQCDDSKYRDDVEIDPSRKERMGVETIVVNVVVLALICFVAYSFANSMTDYIFKTRAAEDRDKLINIKSVLTKATGEEQDYEAYLLPSYTELNEGVDITKWGKPDDELKAYIAESLSINDFSELCDDFYMSENAGIYVQLTDEGYTLELLNVVKDVSYSNIAVDGRFIIK